MLESIIENRFLKDDHSLSKEQFRSDNVHVEYHQDGFPIITSEFWTSKQRQGHSLHEISYRACFKPQLPAFFINLLTKEEDIVYDPFSGRGTTAIEAALLNRNVIANDVNPLSNILLLPRLKIPAINEIEERLQNIPYNKISQAEIDLSMFFHHKTEGEIVSLKNYLRKRKANNSEDNVDSWIRMVATNRLTGHSRNFFSVYTLPPNQAISQDKQRQLNERKGNKAEYKDTKYIIMKKTLDLMKKLTFDEKKKLNDIGERALLLTESANYTLQIETNSVKLVVTSPPFLNVIDYTKDNWLRLWFNDINADELNDKIFVTSSLERWHSFILSVFRELHRILMKGGYVAFEVGEIRKGTIKLEDNIIAIAKETGFVIEAIMINSQRFTKTANIWGVKNNKKGTNTNRIVLARKR